MRTNSTPLLMLCAAIVVALWLISPIVTDIRAAWIKRRLRRRLRQEHVDWIERRKQHMREAPR